jgi:hypothetical protein
MVITGIEFEGTSIMKRIKILEVRKFRRDRYGFFLFGLTVEDIDFVAVCLKGGSQISQTNWLRPYRRTVKIPNRRLNEKNLHGLFLNYMKPKPKCLFLE